jgi:hypothetical protein
MNENAETFSTAELVIFDCEPIAEPYPDETNGALPPGVSIEAISLAGRIASQNLPESQKRLIRMMLDGKGKDEIAKELAIPFPELYYLWRDAYRNTRNALDSLPEIGADLRHCTLVRISRITRGK